MAKNIKTPRIPAAIKKLGAHKSAQRTTPGHWNLGFAMVVDEDDDAPGNGAAIVEALRTNKGFAGFTVSWSGSQDMPIHISAPGILPTLVQYEREDLAALGPVKDLDMGEENFYFTVVSTGTRGFVKFG